MIEAMKQALEALEECRRDPRLKYEHPTFDKAITSLRQAIAGLESQEPVAWISPSGALYRTRYHAVANAEQLLTPLFTHPPQRTWVGLTKDEVDSWNLPDHPTVFEFAKFIETKIKGNNT